MGRIRAEIRMTDGDVKQATMKGKPRNVIEAGEMLYQNQGTYANKCINIWKEFDGIKEPLIMIIYHYEEWDEEKGEWVKKATWEQDLETGMVRKLWGEIVV